MAGRLVRRETVHRHLRQACHPGADCIVWGILVQSISRLRHSATVCYSVYIQQCEVGMMEVGTLDFEAGNPGNELDQVYRCLPNDRALTESEIRLASGLSTKSLNYALSKLEEMGKIKSQWLGASNRYLKVMRVSPHEWFTIDEAADHLRVSRRTIYQLVQEKQLTSYRVGRAGHRRFKLEDLSAAMQREEVGEISSLTAVADPVLAELWDNEKDAAYDAL